MFQMERFYLEDLGVNNISIVFKELTLWVWIRFVWLRIGTSEGLL
jgi:hypothetical protein